MESCFRRHFPQNSSTIVQQGSYLLILVIYRRDLGRATGLDYSFTDVLPVLRLKYISIFFYPFLTSISGYLFARDSTTFKTAYVFASRSLGISEYAKAMQITSRSRLRRTGDTPGMQATQHLQRNLSYLINSTRQLPRVVLTVNY